MGVGMSVSPQIWQQFVDLVFQDNLIKHKQNFDVIMDDTFIHLTAEEHMDDPIVTSTVFESKDEPTQMTKQSFTIIDFITFRKSIHFKLIGKNVHN